jgi:integrative and conjugative element protein (TIGR02256 family)
LRNSRRVPVEAQDFSVSLAGVGALGSTCAELLGKAGLSGVRIADPDILNGHNVVRHMGGVGAVGIPKAFMVSAFVADHNPHCDVTSDACSVLDIPLDHPFWRSTAILSTVADDGVELAFNREAMSKGVTTYYLRALRSGTVGRLIRVRPGIDACLECVANYHADGDRRALPIPTREDEVISRECGQPVLASSAADLAVVSGLGVRQLLADLAGPGSANQWVWASEGIEDVAPLKKPFSQAILSLPPHPRCSICGSLSPRRVRLSAAVKGFMLDEARRLAPNETGGILVGRCENDIVDVLFASDAGPLAASEPFRFVRDGEHCQTFLEARAVELPGVDYVGEWHSHPNASPTPSARDIASFEEIAADPDYLTNSPLLVVVAPALEGDAVGWSYTIFPVGGSGRSIDDVEIAP